MFKKGEIGDEIGVYMKNTGAPTGDGLW